MQKGLEVWGPVYAKTLHTKCCPLKGIHSVRLNCSHKNCQNSWDKGSKHLDQICIIFLLWHVSCKVAAAIHEVQSWLGAPLYYNRIRTENKNKTQNNSKMIKKKKRKQDSHCGLWNWIKLKVWNNVSGMMKPCEILNIHKWFTYWFNKHIYYHYCYNTQHVYYLGIRGDYLTSWSCWTWEGIRSST